MRPPQPHRPPFARLLTVLLVALSLLPLPGGWSQPLAAAPAEAPIAPRVSAGGAFGNAQPCLGQPDSFATTMGANTMYFPQGSLVNGGSASNLPSLASVTPSGASPIATLGQLGAVYGLAYDDGIVSGHERLFVSAFTKRLTRYGPAGAGGVYVLTRGATGWNLVASFTVPGVTAAAHSNSAVDPSDKAAIAGVGKTSLGDMEISPDGRTLYIVNIGPRRIERYDLTAATMTPGRLTPISINLANISADAAVQGNLWPFALEMVPAANGFTDPFLAVGVTDTAERGVGAASYAPNGNFTVSPRAHVLLYNTVGGQWYRELTQDLGNDATMNARHAGSRFADHISDWNSDPNHFYVKGWNPWRDDLLQLPEVSWTINYPQPWLTDIEYLSYTPAVGAPVANVPYELALGLRDRMADIVFNATLGGDVPIPFGERGSISQGDTLIYRRSGSAWAYQGERLDDNTHYDPSGLSTGHVENNMGALASIPNDQTGPGAIGESVGTTSLGGLGTQEMRYFARGSGSNLSGAITARPGLIAINTHAATKASNLGDLEVLCSYALVGGRVWNDADSNGIQNSSEGGIANIVLEVARPSDGSVLAIATTDTQGRYLFALPPNTSFHIRINRTVSGSFLAGYWLTLQGQGAEISDSDMAQVGGVIPFVRPGETTTFSGAIAAPLRESEGRSYDIGLTRMMPQGSVGDRVWLDSDGDGVQDAGERGYALPGTVTLRALSSEPGVVDRTAAVQSDGSYIFSLVVPGTYELRFPPPPSGYRPSPQNQGGDDARDSDVDAGYASGPFVVDGTAQTTWDLGVVGGADVSIAKTGPATAAAGGLLTYTLIARNQSSDPSPSLTVVDTLPSGLTFVSATPAPTSRAGQLVAWSLGALAGGASQTLSMVARAPAAFTPATAISQAVQNCADVEISVTDRNPADNRSCATTTLLRPEVGIAKAAPTAAIVGDELAYTLTISNAGSLPAPNVLVADTLPAGLTFVRFDANPLACAATATAVSCPAATLASGASRIVRFVTRSEPTVVGSSVLNTATISTSASGDDPGNNTSTATTIIQRPDPGVTLRLDPRPLPVGEPGSLTAIYRNSGTGLARATVLTVTLEPGADVGATPAGCAYSAGERQLACDLGDLSPGASGAVTLPLRLPATPLDGSTFGPDAYGATAQIATGTPEQASALADNSAASTVEVVRPNVYVTATGPDATARLSWGSGYVYAISYGDLYRAAPSLTRRAEGVVLTATLPADVSLVAASVPPTSVSGQVLVWELGDLAPLAAGVLRVTVRTSVPAGALLHLEARIGTRTPGDDPRDNSAGVDTAVVQPPASLPAPAGELRLAIHSELDPRHGGADAGDGVYLTPPGATRIAWPAGEVLDFTPRLDSYALPDPGWPLQYRARITGWGLSEFTVNGRAAAATGADGRGVRGCRGAGTPALAGSTLQGCAYAYVGAYGDGRSLDDLLPTAALREADMAGQGHAYWTHPPAPSMRPDVYLFTLDPLEPPRLSVAVEVEVWLVNACPDVLIAPPGVCGAPTELPATRAQQVIGQSFDVTLVVPRSVVGPVGP